eukprot:2363554-Amphidinium_carterae.1
MSTIVSPPEAGCSCTGIAFSGCRIGLSKPGGGGMWIGSTSMGISSLAAMAVRSTILSGCSLSKSG